MRFGRLVFRGVVKVVILWNVITTSMVHCLMTLARVSLGCVLLKLAAFWHVSLKKVTVISIEWAAERTRFKVMLRLGKVVKVMAVTEGRILRSRW